MKKHWKKRAWLGTVEQDLLEPSCVRNDVAPLCVCVLIREGVINARSVFMHMGKVGFFMLYDACEQDPMDPKLAHVSQSY